MNTYTQFIGGVAAGLLLTFSGLQAQQSAVSIVFTNSDELRSIDTIITEHPEALTQLLTTYNLCEKNAHILRLDDLSVPMGNLGEKHQEIVFIEMEDIESTGEEPHRVYVAKVDGELKSDRELTPEELEKIKADALEKAMNMEEGEAFEKRIEIRREGDGKEELDVRIDHEIVNGEAVTKAWVNGKEVSPTEAERLLEDENIKVWKDADQESEMIFVQSSREVQEKALIIDQEVKVEIQHSNEAKEAVVIVKKVAAPNGTSEPVTPVEGSISIYPNPAKENVKITFDGKLKGDYSLNIANLAGQSLWKEEGSASGQIRKTVDLADFASGAYIVALSHDRGVHSKKLIVE